MKKTGLVVITFLFVLTADVFAAEITKNRLLGLSNYSNYFSDGYPPQNAGKVRISADYYQYAYDEENIPFAELSGDEYEVDTTLEWALTSYYSQAVIKIRPVEADAILPAGDRRLAGLRLGAAVYKELAELRFLSPRDTAAIGRYEGMLKFIGDNNGVTRAAIENHFRAGIRSLVSGIVAEEFNKISFMLDEKYNSVLTHDPQNGQYQLSYERPSVANDDKTLSGQTLEALLSAMSKSKDFSREAVDAVRDQAYLLPAVVYADWRSKGIAGGVDALALVTDTLTEFYLNPNTDNFNAVLGAYARYSMVNDVFANVAKLSYLRTLASLNVALGSKVVDSNSVAAAKVPSDRRFNIFSTRYSK